MYERLGKDDGILDRELECFKTMGPIVYNNRSSYCV